MPRSFLVFTLLGMILISTEAAGQPRVLHPPPATRLLESRVIVATPAVTVSKIQGTRDSLKNGAVIGAVLGGLGAALFGTYLCHAVGEEGDPPCWRGILVIGALGAGAGAAAGAGVDAMLFRSGPRLVVRVRF
jgi:hypothetical protein